ncbi:MAG: PEP-CTERM sorting domain-containing protein [Proteobacteria bacterium]|nr:PEP-CTERM sorting domain-containing protein [Pseudomonadota bacterium]
MASVTCTSGNYNCTITPNSSVLPTATTPGAYFTVSGNPFVGDVSGSFGRSGLKAGTFTDLFTFTLGQTGIGSGSVTTNFAGNILSAATNLDFTGVWFNNGTTTYDLMPFLTHTGNREDTGIDNVPITTGVLNTITVSYLARGNGSYSGTLQFTPTVPEPATWALLMAGFGVLGFALRRSRRETVRVRYAF